MARSSSRFGKGASTSGTSGSSTSSESSSQSRMRHGPGRVLIAVYAVLGLSATVRGAYQVLFQFSEAPLAYLLSLFAGLVYVVATVALARATPSSWRLALGAVLVELVGVLAVGTLTLADAADFPDGTVWGAFGRDYGWVPLVLPFLGLAWLHRTRPGHR